MVKNLPAIRETWVWSAGGGHGNPLQYSCMGNPHGQRRLAGYSLCALTSYPPGKPWGCKELEHNWGTKHNTIFRSSSVSVQLLTRVWLFVISWTASVHHKLPDLLKLMSIESVMTSNHLIHCHPLLLLPSIFPSIRVFSKESVLHIRWPKYWRFSIRLTNGYSGLVSFRMDWLDLLGVQGTLKSLLQ